MAALASACAHPIGPFVRSVQVDGYDLVLERCEIELVSDTIRVGSCEIVRRRLPVTAREVAAPGAPGAQIPIAIDPIDAALPETLTQQQVLDGIRPLRDAVLGCGARHGVAGRVRVTVVVGADGAVTVVDPDVGTTALAECIGGAYAGARFPATRKGIRFVVPYDLPAATP